MDHRTTDGVGNAAALRRDGDVENAGRFPERNAVVLQRVPAGHDASQSAAGDDKSLSRWQGHDMIGVGCQYLLRQHARHRSALGSREVQ